MQSLPWMCQNYRWGCREVRVDVKTLETHHGECKFRKVICPLAVEFCPREVEDGELICEGKKICLKDIFDHLNTVHKDNWREINGESNKWIQSIKIEGNVSNGSCWFPRKLTSTNGYVFGLVAKVQRYSGKNLCLWMLFFGSTEEARNYSCRISVKNNFGNEFNYSGPVHTLDQTEKAIVNSGFLLSIGLDAAKNWWIKETI